jgi:hypothetical protein
LFEIPKVGDLVWFDVVDAAADPFASMTCGGAQNSFHVSKHDVFATWERLLSTNSGFCTRGYH